MHTERHPADPLLPHRTRRLAWAAGVLAVVGAALLGAHAVRSAPGVAVDVFSPQGEVARVRQARATFSAPMVRFGDPRLPSPFDVRCAQAGGGRWVDDKTWVYDFTADVPAGTSCTFTLKPGTKSLEGDALTGVSSYGFSTGGPAIVRAYPWPGEETQIEEEQAFALLLNGPVKPETVERFAYCAAAGVGERIGLKVLGGAVADAIVKAVGLEAQKARVITVRCARPLPPGAAVELVWAKGIATPSGLPYTAEKRLKYQVRPAFTASFTCERENAHAGCLPIRPLRLEFSAPVPRHVAERVALVTPEGRRPPRLEQGRGEDSERLIEQREGAFSKFLLLFGRSKGAVKDDPDANPVSAVEFAGPFPEQADLRIELPQGFRDDAGRPLANAAQFPLRLRSAGMPPLAKFAAAPFGVLELNAEPLLPVTLRHVEADLATSGLRVGAGTVRDLNLDDDAQIIEWQARLRRFHENAIEKSRAEALLGSKIHWPARRHAGTVMRYGQTEPGADSADPEEAERAARQAEHEATVVETRALSLLKRTSGVRRLELPRPDAKDGRPFEVVGIPLPEPGFHVVEIESPRLGGALLDRDIPMYVRTSVLVTNLAVHFKHGRTGSVAWVTTLDKARPVAGAQVQVSDCQGQVMWKGQTDAQGVARVAAELPPLPWGYCSRDDDTREQAYFISARKPDERGRVDMAFVWSSWNDGIEPWRFHVDTSGLYEETEPARFHTVFDRTLLRAGQTVSMKHLARVEQLSGLRLPRPDELPVQARLVHQGSGQKFEFPLQWRQGRWAETVFAIPPEAKLGAYSVQLLRADKRSWTTGEFRVEEFRLPVMSGRIVSPKEAQIQPREMKLGVQLQYTNGGGAANLPVQVSAQLGEVDVDAVLHTDRWPGFSFRPPAEPQQGPVNPYFTERYLDEDDEETLRGPRADEGSRLVADKVNLTLDRNGAGELTLQKLPEIKSPRRLLVQATYPDPNGEVQTLSQGVPVWPSALALGVRTDSWVSVKSRLAAQVAVLDTQGRPQAGVAVAVRAVMHQTQSVRRRLVGGFYAYDNQSSVVDLGEVCRGSSDARGLVFCETELKTPGEVELIAEAKDRGGHPARAAASVWVTRQGEVWFGGENQDRMDLIPERRRYEPGETAVFQVRMPFRHATALLAVERNGVMETQVVEVDGRDPTLKLPVKAEWGPNVYVSVLAVRGRVRDVPWYSFFTWGWRAPAEWWRAWRNEGQFFQAPTALVDLSKPAFKFGLAEIEVGTAGHRLKVDVSTDRPDYPIRATATVRVKVSLPDGRPAPAGTEVALAAVDEALLELMPNTSWNVLEAMVRKRSYGVDTATAQMQVIGKRHFGRKAVAPGGGGGQGPARELFDTLLLWNPRVLLDAQGQATVKLPLNDALTAFRIVAVADVVLPAVGKSSANAALFGSGSAAIRSTQDLQIVSGLPPLVREGDRYRAMLTLRNTTARPLDVVLSAALVGRPAGPAGGVQAELPAPPAQRMRIEAGGSAETGWDVEVPHNLGQIEWTLSAQAGSGAGAVSDRIKLTQKVSEALPVTVQQATLMQLDGTASLPAAAPAAALRDSTGRVRGGLAVGLRATLADGLPGVRDYFAAYPWGCLEQRASVAVGLRDTGRWRAIASQLPLYLDEDGLAGYFPPPPGSSDTGSDTLTAYLLALSDEASRLGLDFSLPDETRGRMEQALIDFVQGRINRDFWRPAFLRNGDLDVRKLAAIEALSRRGKVQPALLESIQILPNEWPTGAVLDWLQILQRTPALPERARRIAEAEQILRARLNVQGTRLGFSTERDDSWWWLMANGDVNSVRLVLAVLGSEAWRADLPRIVSGALQRQQAGHWSTTVANAWGSVAVEAFARRFEREAVGGSTRVQAEPGGASRQLGWAQAPRGGELLMEWPGPAAAIPGASAASGAFTGLRVTHEGGGKPWLSFTSRAAVPLTQPWSSGFRITRTVEAVQRRQPQAWSRGDVLRVRLDIDAQADMTWVVVADPIPGGATLMGNGLGRDAGIETGAEREDGRAWPAYEERSFEAFRAYYRYVPKGRFSVEYTVRLNNPGRFGLPPTRAEAMYAPEMFGEYPNAALTVQP